MPVLEPIEKKSLPSGPKAIELASWSWAERGRLTRTFRKFSWFGPVSLSSLLLQFGTSSVPT
jgi:hypothetical protein